MGNPDHGTTAINFMPILQYIDYNKSERFSNVAGEISVKLLSIFLECEVPVKFLIDMVLNFQLKVLKENTEQKSQLVYRKLKLLITEKLQGHFKVTLGIQTIKTTA